MEFHNTSFNFLDRTDGRTHGRTDARTDKPKAVCSPLFQSWGHKEPIDCALRNEHYDYATAPGLLISCM